MNRLSAIRTIAPRLVLFTNSTSVYRNVTNARSIVLTPRTIAIPTIRQFRQQTSTQTDVDFERAKKNLPQITVEVSNEDKLLMYALFKQVQNGPCNTKKPSALNVVEKAKWLAWKQLGDMSNSEAKEQYVAIVNRLIKESTESSES